MSCVPRSALTSSRSRHWLAFKTRRFCDAWIGLEVDPVFAPIRGRRPLPLPGMFLCFLLLCLSSVVAAAQLQGGCWPESSPYLQPSENLREGRITYCESGDADIATLHVGTFPAGTGSVELMLSGRPDNARVRMEGACVGTSSPTTIELPRVGDSWRHILVPIPPPLTSCPFVLALLDESNELGGWAGIGFPTASMAESRVGNALTLLSGVAFGSLWLALVAASVFPGSSASYRTGGAVLFLGAAAYLSALSFYFHPSIGKAVSIALLMAPLGFFVFRQGKLGGRPGLGSLLLLTAAPSALALLVLWAGLFPFYWDGSTWEVPANRWRSLPVDNWLPFMFAQMLLEGRISSPMTGDWLGSDRPPLQSGIHLLFNSVIAPASGLAYQAISTWAQALILIPALALLPNGWRSIDKALALLCLGLSSLVFLNALFVWPKLLAASFCAIYHLGLFRPRANAAPFERLLLPAVAASLAMLSHGGALFGLAGSTIVFVFQGGRAATLTTARIAVVSMLVYSPWVAFQKLVDPPGDRLVKWHFAGQIAPTDLGTVETIKAAYAGLSLSEWTAGRLVNLEMMASGTLSFFTDAGHLLFGSGLSSSKEQMLAASFFSTAYSMWFFGPLAIALALLIVVARRRPVRLHLWSLPSSALIAAALWVGLLNRRELSITRRT